MKGYVRVLHVPTNDPDQLVNIAALPATKQSDPQRNALAKLRARCDELIAQNGPTTKDLLAEPKEKPRKK